MWDFFSKVLAAFINQGPWFAFSILSGFMVLGAGYALYKLFLKERRSSQDRVGDWVQIVKENSNSNGKLVTCLESQRSYMEESTRTMLQGLNDIHDRLTAAEVERQKALTAVLMEVTRREK